MYNRYIRNDQGIYQRIPEEDGPPHHFEETPPPPPNWDSAPPPPPPPPPGNEPPPPRGGRKGFLSDLLGRLHLDGIDTGDLLLLALLFFLFREDADEELLVALGLLLIL